MAVARIELCWEASEDERRLIVEATAEALVEALRVPPDDPTVIAVNRPAQDVAQPAKVGGRYTIVTVTMFSGRSPAAKRALYAAIVERLERCGVPATDVLIILDEVPAQNWGVDGGIPASEADVGFKIDI